MSSLKRKREKHVTFDHDAEVHTVQRDGKYVVTSEPLQQIPYSSIYNKIMKSRRTHVFTVVQMYDILEACKTEQLSVKYLLTKLIEETRRRQEKLARDGRVHLGAWKVIGSSVVASILSVMNKTMANIQTLKENYDDFKDMEDSILGVSGKLFFLNGLKF
jgi:hypothetical protein